jgi:agmatinase
MTLFYHARYSPAMSPIDPNAPAQPGSGIFGLDSTPEDAGVVVIPVPWEATVSYRAGTARGPAAIRAASTQVDLYDVGTGRPYQAGIAMLDELPEIVAWNSEARALAAPVIAAGGAHGDPALERAVSKVNDLGERMNDRVRAEVDRWMGAGKLVGVVGGDHAVAFGAIAAAAARHEGLGVLHIDAHADLRDAYEGFTWSHASVMRNVVTQLPDVRLVSVGVRDLCEAEVAFVEENVERVSMFYDEEMVRDRFEDRTTWQRQCLAINDYLPTRVHISLDVDGLDPSLCPHTGTPVPGGLNLYQLINLLHTLVRGGHEIVSFDLVEVAPGPAGDEWDAAVGARLLYKLVGWALKSREREDG